MVTYVIKRITATSDHGQDLQDEGTVDTPRFRPVTLCWYWGVMMQIVLGFLLMSGSVFGDLVQKSLEYVHHMSAETCNNSGTANVLYLDFDVQMWNKYTDPAIRTANFLSKVLNQNGGNLNSMSDETFFLLVRNNVHGDSLIFGSAIALETGVYSKYEIFCPYAYKKAGNVRSHDIAIFYNYLSPETEWYFTVQNKTWHNVTMVTDGIKYRQDNVSLAEVTEVYPIAILADGHWTKPYFDCGGGDIWMVTYSSPIFKLQGGDALFQGVATIDIELTNIDINQCDNDGNEATTGLDIFRGTHMCQTTTKCIAEPGKGFTPGAYICKCTDGYYFPDHSSSIKAYNGTTILDKFRQNGVISPGEFRCAACAAGCTTCTDDSPCLFEKNEILMACLLTLNVIILFGIIAIGVFTFLYRSARVIKSASPIFLLLMCLGAVLVCFQFFTMYADASEVICSVRIWPMHVGFTVLYSSLILKTWRISVIFSVGMQKRIRLPDQVLIQRFVLVLALTLAVLVAWNASQPPTVSVLTTGDEKLKLYLCDFGLWEYVVIGVETSALLYGVYLCYKVRKAPAHFNESKHITWAVYNAIILGSFMTIMSRLVLSVIGPNVMLALVFAQLHVYSTVTILIIFIPKLIALKKNAEVSMEPPTMVSSASIMVPTITGRVKSHQIFPLNNFKHAETQTSWHISHTSW